MGNELLPASFNVRVTAGQAPAVSRLIEGNLTIRNEFVSVASIMASPPFVNPKVTPPVLMFISAKILNAVNRARSALVSFKVKNSNGQEVFASSPVSTALSVQTSLTDVDLGAFNPEGLPAGTYTAEVSVTDADGTPIPGGTGTGNLLLGSPVTASLSNAPDKLPPGTSTVSNMLKINSQLILPPLSVVGQAQIPGSNARSGVAVKDNIAYACSENGVQLFDVSDPALPVWLKTVGSGINIGCKIQGDLLLALALPSGNTGSHILRVYSLTGDALNPVLFSITRLKPPASSRLASADKMTHLGGVSWTTGMAVIRFFKLSITLFG